MSVPAGAFPVGCNEVRGPRAEIAVPPPTRVAAPFSFRLFRIDGQLTVHEEASLWIGKGQLQLGLTCRLIGERDAPGSRAGRQTAAWQSRGSTRSCLSGPGSRLVSRLAWLAAAAEFSHRRSGGHERRRGRDCAGSGRESASASAVSAFPACVRWIPKQRQQCAISKRIVTS